MMDQWKAYIDTRLMRSAAGSGVLNGLNFSVKDVFSIKNYKNSAGNPDWLRTHFPAKENAAAIDRLLKQGASLKGTTHTDELMYSLNGENFHYGTPVNPISSDRIPGGSSSGSAVAVAAGCVDFALGTDTGGSVRVPSAYCGLYGIRPTHGAVPLAGVIPLSKSFDTVGWMTKNPVTLKKVGETLIQQEANSETSRFNQLYFDQEAWSFVANDTRDILIKIKSVLQDWVTHTESIRVADTGLANWASLFRMIQGLEIWAEHGDWIESVQPVFGPGIAERFQWTSTLDQHLYAQKQGEREAIEKYLTNLLANNALLVIPTAPGEAPLKGLATEDMEDVRSKTMQLTCIAGLAGLPQVTIPLKSEKGHAIGLSFIANKKQDLNLLNWTEKFISYLKDRKIASFD
ncbi:amidase [Pullulanibacillus sp. KACC 23026]|uniref:amidase n=1 Tax=Pullulanibacillus sp. KACC 23026 TaxID=3028315 RepID=UPI0023B1CC9E|nr:amidase [Pullulanibacillus sp. KACC 23026]WEG14805.1 amidase [Pullulanibacillus sp. KACC 23026]